MADDRMSQVGVMGSDGAAECAYENKSMLTKALAFCFPSGVGLIVERARPYGNEAARLVERQRIDAGYLDFARINLDAEQVLRLDRRFDIVE